MEIKMNNNLRKLNNLTSNIIDELEVDMKTSASQDAKAYYELSKLIVRIDRVMSLMLSDIDENRIMN
jgi:hypothetical protein